MRNASQFGEEQTPVCEPCAGPHCNVTPIVRARKRIATFHVKCPLATRGCDWNSTIAEVETHLGLCEEFVVSCSNKCEQFMKRSELGDHSFSGMRVKICTLRVLSNGDNTETHRAAL